MSKTKRILYWVFTAWLALGLISTGLVQVLKIEDEVNNILHLGYPVYVLTILGIWKLLAVPVVLLPRLALVKEWAYAGIFFNASGAFISYLAIGDPLSYALPPLLLGIICGISWYLRPADRKLKF